MAEALWNRNQVKTAVRIEFGMLYSGCTPSARRPEARRGRRVAQGALYCMRLRVARSVGNPTARGDDRSSQASRRSSSKETREERKGIGERDLEIGWRAVFRPLLTILTSWVS